MDRSQADSRDAFMRSLRSRHPGFRESVVADARISAARRGERSAFRSKADTLVQIIRLAWMSDAFLAQALYRAKARMQALGIPLLPRVAHRLAMGLAQVSIGDPVVIQPGIYILHGQVVVDGLVEIGPDVAIGPFVTIGLRPGSVAGPKVGRGVSIGTGAKVLGEVTIGANAKIAPNAVVIDDVEPGATVVGAPAKPL